MATGIYNPSTLPSAVEPIYSGPICYQPYQIGQINVVLLLALAAAFILYIMINERNHQ